MDAKLSVEIGADVSKLNKGMAEAAKIVSSESKKISSAASSSSNSLDKFDNSAKKSKMSSVELGRVLQDLPFGFIGIQNNLTQLIPAVGGLGLAFSALVSAITFAQVGTTYWSKGGDDAKRSVSGLKEEIEAYIETLGSLESANLKAADSYTKDVSSLERLYKASQNMSLSLGERKKAVDLLQSEYPSYFKNISDETILNGGAKDSYDRLTQAIIAKAKAQAYADEIAENSSEIRNTEKLLELRNQELTSLNQKLKTNKENTAIAAANAINGFSLLQEEDRLNSKILEKNAQINALKAKNIPLLGSNMALEREITKLVGSHGVEVLGVNDNLKGTEEAYKRIKTEALDYNKAIREQAERTKKATAEMSRALSDASGVNDISKILSESVKPQNLEFNLLGLEPLSPEELNRVLNAQLWEDKIEDLSKRIDSSIRSSLGGALTGIAEGLGESLANGTNIAATMGNVLLSTIGELAINLGKLAVGTGVAIGGIKKALSSLNPATAIAGGLALIALGAAVKGAAANIASGGGGKDNYQIPKFANGVTNFSGGMALVGERGPELVTLPTGSNVITNENLRRYGNGSKSNTNVFIPNLTLKGQDIVIAFNRASRSLNRMT